MLLRGEGFFLTQRAPRKHKGGIGSVKFGRKGGVGKFMFYGTTVSVVPYFLWWRKCGVVAGFGGWVFTVLSELGFLGFEDGKIL
jgi:hypothetical protein